MGPSSLGGATQTEQRLAEAYRDYPATAQLTYLDVAVRGLLSRQVRTAIDAHLDTRMLHGV